MPLSIGYDVARCGRARGQEALGDVAPGEGCGRFDTGRGFAGFSVLSSEGACDPGRAVTFWAQRYGALVDQFGVPLGNQLRETELVLSSEGTRIS